MRVGVFSQNECLLKKHISDINEENPGGGTALPCLHLPTPLWKIAVYNN